MKPKLHIIIASTRPGRIGPSIAQWFSDYTAEQGKFEPVLVDLAAFNLPVFEELEADPDARALYLYPTKALANDQLATLEQMAAFTGIAARPAIYDGDTPQSKRAAIRDQARIIVSWTASSASKAEPSIR